MTQRTNVPPTDVAKVLPWLVAAVNELFSRGRWLDPEKFGEGDGVQTDWVLQRGHRPVAVWRAGLMQTKGAAGDYTVSEENNVWTISFAVAPGLGVPLHWQVEVQS